MAAMGFDVVASRFGEGGSPFLSARRVAEQLGVTLSELAKLTGVARNTLTAKSSARKVDSALIPPPVHAAKGFEALVEEVDP